jgi:pimeloyl-ACP methyl ester carboxylesterase
MASMVSFHIGTASGREIGARKEARDEHIRVHPLCGRRRLVLALGRGRIRERGHDVVAPDLPCDDDAAALPEYADAVAKAIGDRTDLVVVAQSLGGFTAPLVCERVPVELLVLVAPMIPAPKEAPADYWANTRYEEEGHERYEDDIALFYQDVPPEVASEALRRSRRQSEARLGEPSPLAAWPAVPTRVLLCRDDRLFPAAFAAWRESA